LSAYSSATARKNLINQTDLTFELNTGAIRHKLLAGAEYSKQETDNQRLTGYFSTIGANTTSINVPISMPLYQGVISFRAAGSDADNHGEAVAKAVYLQDQLELTEQWHAVLGARYDQFSVDLHNNRNNSDLRSDDDLVSPRAGLIYKPITDVSAYINYSKSYVPRAGEQLAGLSATNAALEPEAFVNREVGLKWDLSSQLAVTAALYQLDRTNVAVTDPTNPTKLQLVDGQNVQGVELELQGQIVEGWDFVAGYANQDAEVEAPAADRGKTLPQVPKQKLSMWHKYQFNDQWGVGLGLTSQSASFIALDNKITLPGFARWDAAVYYKPLPDVRVQLNVENLTDKHYAASAHNNNNIMPGSPANARLSVSYKF
jgi:catecholate siderophore receptor